MVGSVILILALFGILWYGGSRLAPTAPVYTGEMSEDSQYYLIEAHYPASTPLRESAGEKANQAAVELLKADVEDGVRSFKEGTDPSQLSEEFIQEMRLGTERRYTLAITYEKASSPASISYIFTSYEDTFGAHPNTNFLTETFDLKTGKHLALKDLFVTSSKYLDAISTAARTQLPVQIANVTGIPLSEVDTASINTGTEPTDQHFQNFYLIEDALVILFPPYQIGPYSLGPQELSISRSELKNILKPSYQ